MSFGDELDSERAHALRLVRHASTSWFEAMRAHKLAPPDDGFAARLRALAEAAATEQLAWERAHEAGIPWRPVPGTAPPPYELRPGTGRRGPEELWMRFDQAVERLSLAIAGPDATEVAAAFGEMATCASQLSNAVALQDDLAREAHERAREADERAHRGVA